MKRVVNFWKKEKEVKLYRFPDSHNQFCKVNKNVIIIKKSLYKASKEKGLQGGGEV